MRRDVYMLYKLSNDTAASLSVLKHFKTVFLTHLSV